MTDLNQLRERIEHLETEIESVLAETRKLQRAHRRRKAARLALSLVPALLLGACWSLARPPQGYSVHAPFEVHDSSGRKLFTVNNDHSFSVYTEKGAPALIGRAYENDYSFLVAPSDGGPWAKLGLEGSGSNAPGAPATAPQQAGRTGRGQGRSGRGNSQGRGGRAQGGGSGGSAPAMSPFLKLGLGGYSQGDERIMLRMRDGKPELAMRNPNGVLGLLLLQGHAFPGGELGIISSKGEVAARAGASVAGIGRVEAFPLGNPIGSSIVGRVR